MNRSARNATLSRGMTLPELMVGLALGLFIVTIAVSTFVSTRKLNLVSSSSTRMTENARLATETLHTDLRSAGFAGCRTHEQRDKGPPVVVAVKPDFGFLTDGNSGVRGFTGTTTGHSPALPSAIGTALTAASMTAYAPIPRSDVVSIRVPVDTTALGLVASMTLTSPSPRIEAGLTGNAIAPGDILLISNCQASAIYQVSAYDSATGALAPDAGSLTPGNISSDLGNFFQSGETSVYRLQTRHYYVAPSKLRAGTNSLWRLIVPGLNGGAPVPEEVAAGVDRLLITYGVDSDGTPDLNINQYVTASNGLLGSDANKWDRVLSARVQMVAATSDDRMAQPGNKTYTLMDGSTLNTTDARLRMVLTEVVTLRNGTP